MIRVVVICAWAIAACSKSTPTTGSPELDRFEAQRKGEAFSGAYISASGVFVNRKLAVPPGKLATPGALAAIRPQPEWFVFDIDDMPAAVARTLLRDLAGAPAEIAHRDPSTRSGLGDRCTLAASTTPIAHAPATLSIDIQADRVYVGLVPANEFSEIRNREDAVDWEKLETTLKEYKASDLFAERADAELAIDDGYKSATLVHATFTACNVGFTELAILPREQLTARAADVAVVDLSGLATAADVIAKLRAQEGKDNFSARAGKLEVCDWMKVVPAKKKPAKPPAGTGYFVARVHRNGGAWIAMVQTMERSEQPTTEFTTKHMEIEAGALRGELNNMRLFTHLKDVPLELAVDDGVDAVTLLTAIRSACEGRTTDFELRTPGELSIGYGR
jgi:hypothetical protein